MVNKYNSREEEQWNLKLWSWKMLFMIGCRTVHSEGKVIPMRFISTTRVTQKYVCLFWMSVSLPDEQFWTWKFFRQWPASLQFKPSDTSWRPPRHKVRFVLNWCAICGKTLIRIAKGHQNIPDSGKNSIIIYIYRNITFMLLNIKIF